MLCSALNYAKRKQNRFFLILSLLAAENVADNGKHEIFNALLIQNI